MSDYVSQDFNNDLSKTQHNPQMHIEDLVSNISTSR